MAAKGCTLIFSFVILLVACADRDSLAPVVESHWRLPGSTKATKHKVLRGETLYAIAFRYDKDYRHLAEINHLPSPYNLKVGQILTLKSHRLPQRIVVAKSKSHKNTTSKSQGAKWFDNQWDWPAKGRIMVSYVPKQGKKGINISGKKGERIRAASGGVVAYAGDGLSGYGNLIIIKHNAQYLTAYGNNARNLVREGQHVKKGQIIATMGLIDRKYWGVHFEIRKLGKPVNPLNYLKKA